MINPLKSISVTNCLNILLMIKIILLWILLPFPFSLIRSSLCYMQFIFCDYICYFRYEKCHIYNSLKLTLFSSKIKFTWRISNMYCKVRRVILYSQSENWQCPESGNVLPIQNLRQPSHQCFTLKSISDSIQVKHCQRKKSVARSRGPPSIST